MKIIRPNELTKLLGISKSTIWRFEKAGDFPKKINIGIKSVGYLEEDINKWINERVNKNEQ